MPDCRNCSKSFPLFVLVNGIRKNMTSRINCLECSPVKGKVEPSPTILGLPDTKLCTRCNQVKSKEEFYIQRAKDTLTKYCKSCLNTQALERQRGLKQAAIDYKGGKCIVCNYSRCNAAMIFHHLDPSQKDFSISQIKSTKFETIRAELDKCVLLCSRCHHEVHAGLVDPSNLESIKLLNEVSKSKNITLVESDSAFKFQTVKHKYKGTCKFCGEDYESDFPNENFCSNECSALSKRKFTLSYEVLNKLVWEKPTSHIAKEYGVSDNTVGKRCKLLGIKKPEPGYWQKLGY